MEDQDYRKPVMFVKNRQSAAYRACDRQNGGRSGARIDGPTQRARTPREAASDGNGWERGYREAMLSTWGHIPAYAGRGRPPTHKQPGADWQYLQVVKERCGSRLIAVHTQVVYGDPHEVKTRLWEHTAYVERTHLTSRQMNGRLVRKSLTYSKQLRLLRVSCSWEDWVYD